jgi:Flp pilus assembly protein TadD
MNAADDALRVFVAMPGTTMGEHATWRNIDEIKRHLFMPVQEELSARLGRPVDIVIEKDKTTQGPVHQSMFSEALRAPAYIADLTGANPNVYLELGVRWALRDHVTVLIAQDIEHDVLFNAAANRVIRYGPGPAVLNAAKRQIVDAIHAGLSRCHVDSPVREALEVQTIGRVELDGLHREIADLRAERGDSLVAAAETATAPGERMQLLQRALEVNPANARANLLLGITLRTLGRYAEAVVSIQRSVQLDANLAGAWRELGVALSKDGRPREAIDALHTATRQDSNDGEAFANLGGAYRRLARSSGSDGRPFNAELLREARHAYQRASRLSGNDTYPLLNVAGIDLLLSQGDPTARDRALDRYRELEHLARFAVADTRGSDPWKLFDLASTLILTRRLDESIRCVRTAIELVNPEERGAKLESAVEPLSAAVHAGVLPGDVAGDVAKLIEICSSPSQWSA